MKKKAKQSKWTENKTKENKSYVLNDDDRNHVSAQSLK